MAEAEPKRALIAAPFQPMDKTGAVDLERIRGLSEGLRANGVNGAFVCGTTGEGLSLSVRERMQVAEQWRRVSPEGFRTIIQVGHNCLSDAKALAAHAEEIGVDAIAALPPTFYRPATLEELVRYCAEVAEAAPRLPFYYYHIPFMTGVALPMAEFLVRGGERIASLRGIKFTHEDLMDFTRCLNGSGSRFHLLFGREEFLLAALALGSHGFVGSTFNWMAPIFGEILHAFDENDLERARRAQARATEAVWLFMRHGGIPAGKAIMRLIGFDCGPVRSPQARLSTDQEKVLKTELERIGFFEFAAKYD